MQGGQWGGAQPVIQGNSAYFTQGHYHFNPSNFNFAQAAPQHAQAQPPNAQDRQPDAYAPELRPGDAAARQALQEDNQELVGFPGNIQLGTMELPGFVMKCSIAGCLEPFKNKPFMKISCEYCDGERLPHELMAHKSCLQDYWARAQESNCFHCGEKTNRVFIVKAD